MSHVVIVIQRQSAIGTTVEAESTEATYHYQMPVPHGASPQQVGEMVRKAYKRLETDD